MEEQNDKVIDNALARAARPKLQEGQSLSHFQSDYDHMPQPMGEVMTSKFNHIGLGPLGRSCCACSRTGSSCYNYGGCCDPCSGNNCMKRSYIIRNSECFTTNPVVNTVRQQWGAREGLRTNPVVNTVRQEWGAREGLRTNPVVNTVRQEWGAREGLRTNPVVNTVRQEWGARPERFTDYRMLVRSENFKTGPSVADAFRNRGFGGVLDLLRGKY